MIRTEASVETKAAPTPAAKALASAGGTPRRARRTPLSAVAPTMTGRATWRESALASARAKPRRRAAASVIPLRETPGMSAQACAKPRARASTTPASSRRRPVGPSRAPGAMGAGAGSQPPQRAGGVGRGGAQAPLDRARERLADVDRRQEGADDERRPAVVQAARGGRHL